MQHSPRFYERFAYENRHMHQNDQGCDSPRNPYPLAQLSERKGYMQPDTRVVPAWLVHESPAEVRKIEL